MAREKRIFREWQHPRASDGRFAKKGSPEWVRSAADKFRHADEALKRGTAAPGTPGRARISRGAKAERVLATHDASVTTRLGRQPVQGPERPPVRTNRTISRDVKTAVAGRERALAALTPEPARKPALRNEANLTRGAGTASAESMRNVKPLRKSGAPVDTPRVSGQAKGMSTTEIAAPQLSPEQRGNYDKLLGNGPGEGLVAHKQSRQIVEQLEAHGWTVESHSPEVSLLQFKAPDGRELGVQFLTGQHNSKPRFFTGSAARGRDLTYKAALAHVVTPTHEEVGGGGVGGARERLGLPDIHNNYSDHTLKPFRDALQAHTGYGTQHGPTKNTAEVAADLHKAAENNRRTADHRAEYNRGFMSGDGEDSSTQQLRQRADEFASVADEMLKMDRERAAYVAERDRRAALPLDIRPTARTGSAKAAKKAAPARIVSETPPPAAVKAADESIGALKPGTPEYRRAVAGINIVGPGVPGRRMTQYLKREPQPGDLVTAGGLNRKGTVVRAIKRNRTEGFDVQWEGSPYTQHHTGSQLGVVDVQAEIAHQRSTEAPNAMQGVSDAIAGQRGLPVSLDRPLADRPREGVLSTDVPKLSGNEFDARYGKAAAAVSGKRDLSKLTDKQLSNGVAMRGNQTPEGKALQAELDRRTGPKTVSLDRPLADRPREGVLSTDVPKVSEEDFSARYGKAAAAVSARGAGDASLNELKTPERQRQADIIRDIAKKAAPSKVEPAPDREPTPYDNMGRANLTGLARRAGIPVQNRQNHEIATDLHRKDKAAKAAKATALNPGSVGGSSSQHEQHTPPKLASAEAQDRDKFAAYLRQQPRAALVGQARDYQVSTAGRSDEEIVGDVAAAYAWEQQGIRDRNTSMNATLAAGGEVRVSSRTVGNVDRTEVNQGWKGGTTRPGRESPHDVIMRQNFDRTVKPGDTPPAAQLDALNEATLRNMVASAPGSPLAKAAQAALDRKAAPPRYQTFADRMAGDMSNADRLAARIASDEHAQQLRAQEAEYARQRAEAQANDTRTEREKLTDLLREQRAARDIGMRSGRLDPKREARIKVAETRLEAIGTEDRKAKIKALGVQKGDKVKTALGEFEVTGKTGDGYLRVLRPDGRRGTVRPGDVEAVTKAPKADAAKVAAPDALDLSDPAIGADRMSRDIMEAFDAGDTADDAVGEIVGDTAKPIDPIVARAYVQEVVDLYNARNGTNMPGPTVPATPAEAATAQRDARRSANLGKARAAATEKRVGELEISKDPKDNAGKIKAITDGRMSHADLYRTVMAGPSGQRAPVLVGRVRHTPDNPSGEFRVVDRNGQLAGWVTPTLRNGEHVYAVHSENHDGETRLEGWADTLAHAADVLTHGEAAASTGGSLDARRTSGRMFHRYEGRNKTVAELDREALDREIGQHRKALANPNLTPGIRARHEASLTKLEAERRGGQVDTRRDMTQTGGVSKSPTTEANMTAVQRVKPSEIKPGDMVTANISGIGRATPVRVEGVRPGTRGGTVIRVNGEEVGLSANTRIDRHAPAGIRSPGGAPIGSTDAQAAAYAPRLEGESDLAYQLRTVPENSTAERILNGYSIPGLNAIARDHKVTLSSSWSKARKVEALLQALRQVWRNSQAIRKL